MPQAFKQQLVLKVMQLTAITSRLYRQQNTILLIGCARNFGQLLFVQAFIVCQ